MDDDHIDVQQGKLIDMRPLKTLVVEDESLARRGIEKSVREHELLELLEPSAKNGMEALRLIRKYQPELIFMDIELKDTNAFDLLRQLGSRQMKIIFVTAFNNYASSAFDIEAVDYLLKPYSEERFRKAVHRVLELESTQHLDDMKFFLERNLPLNPQQKLVIPEGNTRHFLDGNSVYYIFGQGYYANIVMGHQKKLVRISLKALSSLLPSNFCRINKSIIINKTYIRELIRNKHSLKIIMQDQNEYYVTDNYREHAERFLV